MISFLCLRVVCNLSETSNQEVLCSPMLEQPVLVWGNWWLPLVPTLLSVTFNWWWEISCGRIYTSEIMESHKSEAPCSPRAQSINMYQCTTVKWIQGQRRQWKKSTTQRMSFLLLCTLLVYYSVLVIVIGIVLEKYRSKHQFHLLISLLPWKLLSCVPFFVTPWTVQSTEFSRPEYWSGSSIPFSRGSPQPRDQIQVSHIAGRFFTSWATREAQEYWSG